MSKKTHAFSKSADLGGFLKAARIAAGFTQNDVARKLRLNSAQSISDWEGNRSGSVPIPALKQLIAIYAMDVNALYDVLYAYQTYLHQMKMDEVRSKLRGGRAG